VPACEFHRCKSRTRRRIHWPLGVIKTPFLKIPPKRTFCKITSKSAFWSGLFLYPLMPLRNSICSFFHRYKNKLHIVRIKKTPELYEKYVIKKTVKSQLFNFLNLFLVEKNRFDIRLFGCGPCVIYFYTCKKIIEKRGLYPQYRYKKSPAQKADLDVILPP